MKKCKKFERPRAQRRVKTDTDPTEQTFVADMTKHLRVNRALRKDGIQITRGLAKVIVDGCAEVAKDTIVAKGKAALPNLGAMELELPLCGAQEHKEKSQACSGGQDSCGTPSSWSLS